MNWLDIREPLDTADLDKLEQELNIKLPADYKAKIGPINGGALQNAYLTIPKLGDVCYTRNVSLSQKSRYGVHNLIPILNHGEICYFPFAGDGNGDYFCFDLLKDTVVLYLHEADTMLPICKTFTELLDMLCVG